MGIGFQIKGPCFDCRMKQLLGVSGLGSRVEGVGAPVCGSGFEV